MHTTFANLAAAHIAPAMVVGAGVVRAGVAGVVSGVKFSAKSKVQKGKGPRGPVVFRTRLG